MNHKSVPELICPAGSYQAAIAATENGADAIYMGFQDATNARHFPGLNMNERKMTKAIDFIHKHRKKILIAINTYPQTDNFNQWTQTIDKAVNAGADALILADIALMDYCHTKYPATNIHISVQASATSADTINFYKQMFDIKRVVLPRVITIEEIERIHNKTDIPLEIFGFGGLCVMTEGRCFLSGHLCGDSPNTFGACSPAEKVKWNSSDKGLECLLNSHILDIFSENDSAGYPTPCKGRFLMDGKPIYPFEKPSTLNSLHLIPRFTASGVSAIKIEGRQRSPAYVAKVTSVWRKALNHFADSPSTFNIRCKEWNSELMEFAEGMNITSGCYDKGWY
ncbi:MAG: U32 family peptidase [Gammaproteobacteria bacterium]|nr:MAG: U32 family peptidase [Gammaproteobacteria bacterium]